MTPKNTQKNGTIGLRHEGDYLDFIAWIALPSSSRTPKTQGELAKKMGVDIGTLTDWKNRAGFWEAVKKKRKGWGVERTPDVIYALYNRIMETGSAPEVKLWLQYFEDWFERLAKVTPQKRPFQDLTNQELADVIKKSRDYLLKR